MNLSATPLVLRVPGGEILVIPLNPLTPLIPTFMPLPWQNFQTSVGVFSPALSTWMLGNL